LYQNELMLCVTLMAVPLVEIAWQTFAMKADSPMPEVLPAFASDASARQPRSDRGWRREGDSNPRYGF
jgi:hypothetical protein